MLENLLFSMCTVLYILNGSDILLSSTDHSKNELTKRGEYCAYICLCSILNYVLRYVPTPRANHAQSRYENQGY